MSNLVPDLDHSIAFFHTAQGDGSCKITAIPLENGKLITKSFNLTSSKALRAFLEAHSGRANIYFHVNPTGGDPDKRSKKKDVAEVHYFHVDIDPAPGSDLKEEQRCILERLRQNLPESLPPPTVIIFSGGGYQALWKLKQPYKIDCPEAADYIEQINREIAQQLGGDACHNIDRVLRVPGTINLPTAKKAAAGRTAALAKIIDADWSLTYGVAAFAHLVNDATVPTATAQVDAIPEEVERLKSVDDLDRWDVPPRIKTIIVEGYHPDETNKPQNDRSRWVFDVLCDLARRGVPDHVMFAVITDARFKISERVFEKSDPKAHAIQEVRNAREATRAREATSDLVLNPKQPRRSARAYLRQRRPHLIRTNDTWFDWCGGAYVEIEENAIRANLYTFLEAAVVARRGKSDSDGASFGSFHPTSSKVSDVMDALEALVHHDIETLKPPTWMQEQGPDPREMLAFPNGLLHLPTGDFRAPTPAFFTHNALSFEYQPNTPEPGHWLDFLSQIWGDGAEIALLQEIFGYCLVPDTRQQKIFLLVGPKRAGKGTIAAVLTKLVGERNVCAPSLNNLGGTFALQPLIGKQLAIVSDMRIGSRTDIAAVAEYLLGISGEDGMTIGRKYKDAWTGQLSARFFIMTNEMPRLQDSSAVVASRFAPLVMENSFYGQEDLGLRDRLMTELPSILNWAIEGWRRLQSRGRFGLPPRSLLAIEELEELATPVTAFLREQCELLPGTTTLKAELWRAWQYWCEQNNEYVGNQRQFFRNLIAATGRRISHSKPKIGDARQPCYVGIRLQPPL